MLRRADARSPSAIRERRALARIARSFAPIRLMPAGSPRRSGGARCTTSRAAPRRMSWSETAVESRPKSSRASMTMTTPATMVGARSGCRPRTFAALCLGQRGEALEDPPARGQGHHVAVDAVGRVMLQIEVYRAQGRRGAGHGDGRAPRSGGPRVEPLPRRSRGRPRPARAARRGSAGRWRGGARCGGRRRPGSRRGSSPRRRCRPRARSSRRRRR